MLALGVPSWELGREPAGVEEADMWSEVSSGVCGLLLLCLPRVELRRAHIGVCCRLRRSQGDRAATQRQYLRCVEDNEHDADDLEQAWKKAALAGGYIVEGNARDFALMAGKSLKKGAPRERRARRHG